MTFELRWQIYIPGMDLPTFDGTGMLIRTIEVEVLGEMPPEFLDVEVPGYGKRKARYNRRKAVYEVLIQ